jgi:hypothetical protein
LTWAWCPRDRGAVAQYGERQCALRARSRNDHTPDPGGFLAPASFRAQSWQVAREPSGVHADGARR